MTGTISDVIVIGAGQAGGPLSMCHSAVWPFPPGASTIRKVWGLLQLTSFKVPVSWLDLVISNMAKEWWA